jgi:hypothetical protein
MLQNRDNPRKIRCLQRPIRHAQPDGHESLLPVVTWLVRLPHRREKYYPPLSCFIVFYRPARAEFPPLRRNCRRLHYPSGNNSQCKIRTPQYRNLIHNVMCCSRPQLFRPSSCWLFIQQSGFHTRMPSCPAQRQYHNSATCQILVGLA